MPKVKIGELVRYSQNGPRFLLVDDDGETFSAQFTRQELMPPPPAPPNLGLGTWKLNLDKSKFNPGPAPRSEVRTYEQTPNGVHFTQRGVTADGRDTLVEFTARYDGKDYPLSGSPSVDTVALTVVDKFTVDAVEKKAGEKIFTIRRVISADGKTMTVTSKGTTKQGRTIDNTMAFDRQ